MKIRRTDLLSALDLPCRIAGKAPVSMVNLVANDSVLHITASDGDQNVISRCQCEGTLPSLFVRASLLQSAVEFGAEHIEFNFDEALHYVSGRKKLKIPHVAEAYTVAMSKSKPTVVPVTELADAIDAVRGFAHTSPERYILKSVHVNGSATHLRCEASNGMLVAILNQPAICGDCDFVLPDTYAHTIATTLRMTGAELMLADNMVGVRHSLGHYECKLLDGKFPTTEWSDGKCSEVGMVSRDEWVSVFRAVKSVETNPDCAQVKVEMADKLATLELANETGFSEEIEGNFSPAILHLNGLTFLKCLEAFPAESHVAVEIMEDNNVVKLSDSFLRVFTTQLRAK